MKRRPVCCARSVEERAPELVVVEDAVPRRPPHRADLAAVQERRSRRRRSPHRDGSRSRQRPPRARCRAAGPGSSRGRSGPSPGSRPRPSTDPAPALDLVLDPLGQHLVAAADAEHRPPAPRPAGQRVGQAGRAQPGQIAHRGPRARQRSPDRRRPDPPDAVASVTATPGSAASGSTSVTFDSRGSRTTAIRSAVLARAAAAPPAGVNRDRASPRRRATDPRATAAPRASAVRSARRASAARVRAVAGRRGTC